MNRFTSIIRRPLIPIALVLALILAACSAKYASSMETVIQGNRISGKVEQVNFFPDSQLGAPLSRNQLEPGENNCFIITSTCRGTTSEDPLAALLAYDQYLVYRIFLQVPDPLTVASHRLVDRSFVQLTGVYELPPEDKIYYPDSGFVEIESIDDGKLHGRLVGSFKNITGEALELTGNFRARIDK